MQWLIDLIIEAIGIPPTFIDRGDPPAVDFTVVNFIQDGLWHDLDLSAIVPPTTKAVLLSTEIRSPGGGGLFQLRTKGNVNDHNASSMVTQIAGLRIISDMIVAIADDGIIQYWITAGPWLTINLTVRGWWL